MQISELIEDIYLPQWVDCPGVPGFAVFLRLPDAARGFVLASRALREAEAAEDGPPPEMALYLVRYAVADWRGLTVAGLRQLSQLPVAGAADQEIPYNADNLASLLKISGEFFVWVLQWINQRGNAVKREAEITENLSATPNTTPIPTR